jgi:hypothetical protein
MGKSLRRLCNFTIFPDGSRGGATYRRPRRPDSSGVTVIGARKRAANKIRICLPLERSPQMSNSHQLRANSFVCSSAGLAATSELQPDDRISTTSRKVSNVQGAEADIFDMDTDNWETIGFPQPNHEFSWALGKRRRSRGDNFEPQRGEGPQSLFARRTPVL